MIDLCAARVGQAKLNVVTIAKRQEERHAVENAATEVGSEVQTNDSIPMRARTKPMTAIDTDNVWQLDSRRTGGSRCVPLRGAGRRQPKNCIWLMNTRPCTSESMSDQFCHIDSMLSICVAVIGVVMMDGFSDPWLFEWVSSGALAMPVGSTAVPEVNMSLRSAGAIERVCAMCSLASMSL